jgi:hypothetical protein
MTVSCPSFFAAATKSSIDSAKPALSEDMSLKAATDLC